MSQPKIIIIGAGPVGMTMALCLAKNGIASTILDKKIGIGQGSRAICFARANLELFDDLGIYKRIKDKGEAWHQLNIYYQDHLVYSDSLDNDASSIYPAYINLQQYYLESYLQEAIRDHSLINCFFDHELIKIKQDENVIEIKNKDQVTKLNYDFLIAADGVKSTVRSKLHLRFNGERFKDNFLIVDFIREKNKQSERTFWFDATFNDNKTVLLLKQPDNMWRIDFQLGEHANLEECLKDKFIIERIRGILDRGEKFSVIWKSIYSFKCRRMESFLHKNIFFIGDAAHEVSPFGARGANSGFQDAKNLSQKFNQYINESRNIRVFNQFNVERTKAADENIKQSSRSTRFISPDNPSEARLRNLILYYASQYSEFKSMINSGRLYLPENIELPNMFYDDLYNQIADICHHFDEKAFSAFESFLSLLSKSIAISKNNCVNNLGECL